MMISDKDKNSVEAGGGFVSRWSRRKLDTTKHDADEKFKGDEHQKPSGPVQPPLTDADMPPIEELTPDSDYSGFLSPEISEELHKLALRKLFHGADFNIRDGLDDYDGDYTSYTKMGDIMTAHMKHLMEQESRRKADAEEAESSVIAKAESEQEMLDGPSDTMPSTDTETDVAQNQQLADTLLDDDEADLQSEL